MKIKFGAMTRSIVTNPVFYAALSMAYELVQRERFVNLHLPPRERKAAMLYICNALRRDNAWEQGYRPLGALFERFVSHIVPRRGFTVPFVRIEDEDAHAVLRLDFIRLM